MSQPEMVRVTVDGIEVTVPKGTNLIEVARLAGVEIPHYCYHPHLSVAGNCRMCQISIEGQPKLNIACNTMASDGLKIKTQRSNPDVANAQRATLEFLLINHPLDCTVCDQAGHCKLQDYYYEYNRKPSRFIEEKQHKVKAEVLGPEVVYDGERCIVCTRCTRFCDEATGTGELGVFNRGDRSVIGVFPGKELNNPLSGTVVDLCPVGALTHRRWRFNTRIWYSDQKNSICTGCSTGCNARVATRDGEIVQVKGRLNAEVNKEWMCDEGRYGFHRFQPKLRLTAPTIREAGALKKTTPENAFKLASGLKNGPAEELGIFISPFLTLEEMYSALQLAEGLGLPATSPQIAIAIRSRTLSDIEKILVSPDYAPNIRAGAILGMFDRKDSNWRANAEKRYDDLLQKLKSGKLRRVLILGDEGIARQDVAIDLCAQIERLSLSVVTSSRAAEDDSTELSVHRAASVIFPARTVNEKNGVFVNRDDRLQRVRQLLNPPFGTYTEWTILQQLGGAIGRQVLPADVREERALMKYMASKVPALAGLTPMKIGELGVSVDDLGQPSSNRVDGQEAGVQAAV